MLTAAGGGVGTRGVGNREVEVKEMQYQFRTAGRPAWVRIALVAAVVAAFVVLGGSSAVAATINVTNLQPDWVSAGGGGVFAAYIGPPAYGYVSPGSTAVYDGRQAAIIKAGINVDPTTGHYEDEGLLAFRLNNVAIAAFAAQPLSFDVRNETGTNPVWVRIRLVGGTQYQFVPATNPASWHTVDAAAGTWRLMDAGGNATGPMMTLAEIATADAAAQVDRVYLTLGMGDSYNVGPGVGTVGWVDKVVIGADTYDFVTVTPPPPPVATVPAASDWSIALMVLAAGAVFVVLQRLRAASGA
jgi:hypothetical protein